MASRGPEPYKSRVVVSAVWVRRLSFVLTVVVIALGTMTYRAVTDGTRALAESDVAFHRGDLENAVLFARRAATAYAPGAPHTRAALARLRAIAVGSEGVGDLSSARLAWGAMRAAALEARHVTQPYAPELAEANRALARLSVPRSAELEVRARGEQSATQLLARAPGPGPGSAAFLWLGFALAAAGLGVIAAFGITREGRLVRRGSWVGLALFAIGAACWTYAAYRA